MADDDKVYRVKIDNVKSDHSADPIAVVDEIWLFSRRAGKSKSAAKQMVELYRKEQI